MMALLFALFAAFALATAAEAAPPANASAPAAWRGEAQGGAEDWWGSGDPAHCVAYQARFPDAIKVAIDIDGFAVCGRPGEAVCDDVELTPFANVTCEGAVPHFFEPCTVICWVGMFLCFASIVTNVLCVVGVFGAPGIRTDPRQQTVLLIGLQSLTDFVMSWVCTLSYGPTYFSDRWNGAEPTCNFVGVMLHTCSCATILSLCILTYIRYRHLVVGTANMRVVAPPTGTQLARWYGSVWAFSLGYASTPLVAARLGWTHAYGRYVLHPHSGTCYTETRGTTFYIYLTTFIVATSCVYMVYAYGRMFKVVHRFMRSKAKNFSAATQGTVTSEAAKKRHADMVSSMRKQIKVLRMLIVIVGVYVLNWGVVLWQFVMGAAGYETPPVLSLWTAIGAITNSCVNPLIYWAMNQKFRETCTTTWRGTCAGAARRIGLPDPVAAYDRRTAARSVAPTGYTGPATMASTAVQPSAFDPEGAGDGTGGPPAARHVELRTVHESSVGAGSSVVLASSYHSSAAESGGGTFAATGSGATGVGDKATTEVYPSTNKGELTSDAGTGGLLATSLKSSDKNTNKTGGDSAYPTTAAMDSSIVSTVNESQDFESDFESSA